MDISVSTGMGFENRENQQNVQQNSTKTAATVQAESSSEPIIRQVASLESPWNSREIAQLIASTQITLNSSLKETLKYLKTQEKKNKKNPIFGELWEEFEEEPNNENPYEEIIDYEIDNDIKNIFEAA